MDIGGTLRKIRKRQGKSQEHIALLAGTNAGNLSRVERNIQKISVQGLGNLCQALGISLSELFEELEGKAPGSYLRDPTRAFDDKTRRLITLSENLNANGLDLLIKIADDLTETPNLS